MKLGTVLSTTAVSGMLAALAGCGGGAAAGAGEATTPTRPATDVPAGGEKNCCRGKNACKRKSGCKTQTNAACAGQNDCKGQGTSCPRG